jgi:hypothetical protein
VESTLANFCRNICHSGYDSTKDISYSIYIKLDSTELTDLAYLGHEIQIVSHHPRRTLSHKTSNLKHQNEMSASIGFANKPKELKSNMFSPNFPLPFLNWLFSKTQKWNKKKAIWETFKTNFLMP